MPLLFFTPSVDEITKQLHRTGFSRWGNERVYNGRTGEIIHSMIFMGPTYYQGLVHIAEDKVKFRNTGPVHSITRQLVADRERFGGIKFGEMERETCMKVSSLSILTDARLQKVSERS